jgi:hypothetical protein
LPEVNRPQSGSGKKALTEGDIVKGGKPSAGEIASSSIGIPAASNTVGPAGSDISALPADISQTRLRSNGLQLPEENTGSGSVEKLLTKRDVVKLFTHAYG